MRSRLAGLLVRKECWRLSARGWFAAIAIVIGFLTGVMYRIHPFLAFTHRVNSEILVIDSMTSDYPFKMSLEEFRAGHYARLLTTGGLVKGGVDLDDNDTYAHMAAQRLPKLGAEKGTFEAVPAAPVRRDRTYASAVAVSNWLSMRSPQVKSINVISVGPHARRTRLLYEKALGSKIAVGVIAIQSPEYDPTHWWQYSEGVKEVISEGAAYLYARFLFQPAE